ncbi:DUF3078 domain-containing protein [Flavobacterium sp. LHD-80]|uniref:DUF3078 domain-containing protein n=1 Tax=Flavobacterium sp. LHD-80 TaxID=3071411 RepID=UPI0027E1B35A|nr:DUF3078 domain-containing protein [Flavobacterium sp. LHD-80]MDQ6470136.1 DUF3078 domain-containing protein [Flavobacterium sp. LHD-80]
MRKLTLLLFVLVNFTFVQAQNSEKELITNTEKAVKKINDTIEGEGWKTKGTVSLLLNQSSFNNWIAGGEDSFSGTLGINYDFNYKKDDVTWDNKILASYGLLQTKNDDFTKKTDDRLEFNSIVGKKAFGQWYYSYFLNFRTQFSTGYIYGQDPNGKQIRTEQTKFMSPGYLTTGPGIYWTKDANLKINFAPLTSKFTFVDNAYTTGIDRFTGLPYVDGAYFGVDEGKSMRYELGFYASVYYKLAIMTNVTAENTLNLYSNYLEDPQNVDIDYSLNIVMKVNKFLSANLSFQAIYDDNAFEGLQTREVFGLGVNFGF